jgi:hypothetical protein
LCWHYHNLTALMLKNYDIFLLNLQIIIDCNLNRDYTMIKILFWGIFNSHALNIYNNRQLALQNLPIIHFNDNGHVSLSVYTSTITELDHFLTITMTTNINWYKKFICISKRTSEKYILYLLILSNKTICDDLRPALTEYI